MERLTIKELAPYLPYRLKLYLWNGGYEKPIEYPTLIGLHGDSIIQSGYRFKSIHCGDEIFSRPEMSNSLSIIKPLLRPFSQLTEEIEHNGERFVPIIELFKLRTQVTGDKIADYYIENNTAILSLEAQHLDEYEFRAFFEIDLKPNEVMFSIATETWKDEVMTREDVNLCGNEMTMFDKLQEWHFDTKGLLERQLALPIDGKEVEGE